MVARTHAGESFMYSVSDALSIAPRFPLRSPFPLDMEVNKYTSDPKAKQEMKQRNE